MAGEPPRLERTRFISRARGWGVATVAAAGLGLIAALAAPASAQSDALAHGRLLAERDCGMCHAIAADDESVHPHAPAFRDLRLHFSADNLSQLVTGGMLSGRPHMPAFRLTDEEYRDLARYLNQLQDANAVEPGR